MKNDQIKSLSILFLLLICAALFGCSGRPESVEKPTVIDVPEKAAKRINLVCDEYPPYEMKIDGEAKGISADLVKEVFQRMGYEVVIKVYPWERALKMTVNGDADGIFSVWKTPERESVLLYSDPIGSDIQSFFVTAESDIDFDGDYRKLKGYKIGTIQGFSYGREFDLAMSEGIIQTIPTADVRSNFEKLLSNRVDIYAEGKYTGLYTLKKMNRLNAVKILSPDINQTEIYVGFTRVRDMSAVAKLFNKILKEVTEDGTKEKIIDSYTKDIP